MTPDTAAVAALRKRCEQAVSTEQGVATDPKWMQQLIGYLAEEARAVLAQTAAALPISDYAMQHAEHYGLRPRAWSSSKVVRVELTLMDAEGEFIDEAGCNCDLDDPCNNPQCVKERTPWG